MKITSPIYNQCLKKSSSKCVLLSSEPKNGLCDVPLDLEDPECDTINLLKEKSFGRGFFWILVFVIILSIIGILFSICGAIYIKYHDDTTQSSVNVSTLIPQDFLKVGPVMLCYQTQID